jgi:hypothetical protein
MSLVRHSTVEDAHSLAPRLRSEDVAEIHAATGHSPLEALLGGVQGTECFTIVSDETQLPMGMFGINHVPELGPLQASVWMLASPDLPKIKAELFNRNEAFLKYFLLRYPLLWNYVDARNTTHLKWIEKCGFTFLKLHPTFGHEKRPFYEFVRIQM